MLTQKTATELNWKWDTYSSVAAIDEDRLISSVSSNNCCNIERSVSAFVDTEIEDDTTWNIKIVDIAEHGYIW